MTTSHTVTTADEPRWRRLGPDARRNEILAVAIRMFGEQPYATVQMAELAREAGVARGLLNHYFGTKRDLYVEVVRAMMIVPEIDTVTLPGGTLRERVEASVDWLMTVLDTHGKTWLAVGVEGIGDDPQIAAILNEADDRAAQRVLDAIGFDGSGSEHQVALAVFRSWGGMMKATAREWVDRKTLSRKQARTILIETLVPLAERVMSGSV